MFSQVQTLFNMFLSHTKEMFKKMNHVHPAGQTKGLVEDLGVEVGWRFRCQHSVSR